MNPARVSSLMSHRRFALFGLAVALLALPLSSLATSVIPPQFDDLVGQSDYVVRAVVTSVTSEWQTDGTNKHIITKVALDVSEVYKGVPPQPLVLEMLGGRVGEIAMTVEGAPKFNAGDEGIFFIHGNGQQFSPLVGIMHGVYPILHDSKSGQDLVLKSNGMPLYSEQDVSLPMTTLSPTKAKNPTLQPMTAAAFVEKVRASALGTKQPAPR